MLPSNVVLGAALLFFFYAPPFTDLLPFLAPFDSFSCVPPLARPVVLCAALASWLWRKTPGRYLLVLARFAFVLPAVLMLSIPLFPEALFDRRWTIADGVLFFLASVALAFVTPSLKRFSVFRKVFFVVTLWLASAAFMFFAFLLVVHADPVPLSVSFSAIVLLFMAGAYLSGERPKGKLKLLAFFCSVACVAAIAQSFPERHGLTEAPDNEEETRNAALITAGPYLQNLQRTGVTVMWETSAAAPGEVLFSTRKEALDTPSAQDCRTVQDKAVGLIHEVRIDFLTEDTQYYYRVVSNGVADRTGCFRTAYEGSRPFEFAVYGDSQEVFDWAAYLVRNRHKDVCESILRYSPEARFVVHVGDMTFLGNQHERWDREFFTPARELMRNTVLWPVLGNHEMNASWYFDFFSVPNQDEHYYSFNFGNSHFIILAVEGYAVGHEYGPPTRTPMDPGSPQFAWLEQDLANSQDKTWRFVFFHQSAFASGIEGAYTPAREILAPLFEKYGVAAVFSGHDHDFECSVKDGVVYVITGGGGGPVNSIALDKRKNPYSRYFRGAWHHCNVRVDGNRFDLKAILPNGQVFYRFRVDKALGPIVPLEE